MGGIKVILTPDQRYELNDLIIEERSLTHYPENPNLAYLPMSLRNIPENLKELIRNRIEILKNLVLKPAGIDTYDPGTAEYSPDRNHKFGPETVTPFDIERIIQSRYLVMVNLVPSTGSGIELQNGVDFTKCVVEVLDNKIGVTLMRPLPYGIRIGYDNLEKQAESMSEIFFFLKEYELGLIKDNGVAVIGGFKKNEIVSLEKEVYERFPEFKWVYHPEIPPVKLTCTNPEIFYENQR